jgi:hypothetical protein
VGGALSLPPYIAWTGHGASESSPSATFKGAHANLFAFDGQAEAIQHLVDKLLNPAARGQVRYSPAISTVILSFVDVARCASRAEPVGWTTGRECGLWTMLWETPTHGGFRRLVFWSPYVFIDYSLGLVTGREVWGWPKAGARIGMATDHPHAPAAWECRTLIFRDFDPHKPGGEEALIVVRALHPHAPESIWSRAGHFLEHASAEMLSGIAEFAVADCAQAVPRQRAAGAGLLSGDHKLALPADGVPWRRTHGWTLRDRDRPVPEPPDSRRPRGPAARHPRIRPRTCNMGGMA